MAVKIPFNQIILDIDWECFDECKVGCKATNEDKLQALIHDVCTKTDWSAINLKCLSATSKSKPEEILSLIIDAICNLNNTNSGINGTTIDTSKITLCGKDNWSYTSDECLSVLSDCFQTKSVEAILQALVKRVNTYSFYIQQQNLKIIDLSNKYTQLLAEVNQIKVKLNQCCPG